MFFPRCTSPIGIFPDRKNKINPVLVPCGRCHACLISRSSSWALRSMMEYKAVDERACFLTLTYDDDFVADGMLHKRDLQLFFKRFRFAGFKFRYFACGEYGEQTARPHFHVLVFGVSFDEIEMMMSHRQYCSNGVRGNLPFWSFGFVHLGTVSEASCQYVAKYILKASAPSDSFDMYGYSKHKPFQVMSRRPALGNSYMCKHYKRILSGRDPLIRFMCMDENATPTLPRFVRDRCEEIEFLESGFDPAVSELHEIRRDNRCRYAEQSATAYMTENKLSREEFDRLQLEKNRQRDYNLAKPRKAGLL